MRAILHRNCGFHLIQDQVEKTRLLKCDRKASVSTTNPQTQQKRIPKRLSFRCSRKQFLTCCYTERKQEGFQWVFSQKHVCYYDAKPFFFKTVPEGGWRLKGFSAVIMVINSDRGKVLWQHICISDLWSRSPKKSVTLYNEKLEQIWGRSFNNWVGWETLTASFMK